MMRSLKLLGLTLLVFVVSSSHRVHAGDPAGRWRGEWRSQSTGHHGPMRANIRGNGDGTYDARFTGRFALVIPFTYKVKLSAFQDSMGQPQLHAHKPLGPIMGSYSMNAAAIGNQLNGSFRAAKDLGTIRMERVR